MFGGVGIACGVGTLLMAVSATLSLRARDMPLLHLGGLGAAPSLTLFTLCYLLGLGVASLVLWGARSGDPDQRHAGRLLGLAALGLGVWTAWLGVSSWRSLAPLAQLTIAVSPLRLFAWALPLAAPLALLAAAVELSRRERDLRAAADAAPPGTGDADEGRTGHPGAGDGARPWWGRAGRWLRAGR
jgi:hypothetical protein